jgi:hypothetical protein
MIIIHNNNVFYNLCLNYMLLFELYKILYLMFQTQITLPLFELYALVFFNAFFCLGLHLVVGFIPVLLKPLLDDLQRDPHDAMTTQKVLFIKTVKHENMKSDIYLRYLTVWTMIYV